MKYLKTYEIYKNSIYDELFSEVGHTTDLILKQKYPYYRATSFKRLKSVMDFPFFDKFLDEILLDKFIKTWTTELVIKKYDFGSTYIRFHDKNNVIDQISDMQRFRLFYKEYPKIGPLEKEVIDFLDMKKTTAKYNL